MSSTSSGAPSPSMTGPPRWAGTGDATPGVCGSRPSTTGRDASGGYGGLLAGALHGAHGLLDLREQRPQVALGGVELPAQPGGGPEHAVGDAAEDDDGQDGDDDPHHEEEHGLTLTGVAGDRLRLGPVAVERRPRVGGHLGGEAGRLVDDGGAPEGGDQPPRP